MLNYAFVALTWLIGLLGVGGAIAVIAASIFLGPTVVIGIVQPMLSRFMACTKCVVATVFVLATVGAYWIGHHAAAKECRDADLAAALRNAQLDRNNAEKAKTDETKRANKIETDANDRHKKDLADIALLKSRPPTCAFDDIDAGSVPDRQSGTGGARAPASARKAGEGASRILSHKHLPLPLVQGPWLPWGRRAGDAAPHN